MRCILLHSCSFLFFQTNFALNKGLGYVEDTNKSGIRYFDGDSIQIFDTADYIIPAIEYNSVFSKFNYNKVYNSV